MPKEAAIEGFVAPGFERVAEAFGQNFKIGEELGAAFAAVQDGVLVVDIWGGVADRATSRPWTRDTLQLVFSGSKGVLATMILMLIDRGLIDIDVPVSRYWPEFGKDAILVRHIVSHTARLPGNDAPLSLADLTDDRGMALRLARQSPSIDPRAAHCYHALNFSWLCGELVRRVSGQSAGQFLAQEIAGPLSLELWMGLPEAREKRASTLYLAPDWGMAPFLDPTLWARDSLIESIWGNPPLWGDPVNWTPGTFPWNTRAFHRAEIAGAGAIGTARAIATLYGVLAQGGAPLLSRETLALGRRTVADGLDEVHGARLRTGIGFQLQTELRLLGPPEDAFGHNGAGGSSHGAWPEHRIGFSYAMNLMRDPSSDDQRALRVLTALHKAVKARDRHPRAAKSA
ncbi:serine hydrolase [Methylocapsa sp. S129]|uniref:serine hydrolase domain-containing protein n=1 Tax=Methylocapsa sp. S129 TaxID=1641869 RepID=UPI00131ADCDE|nr:serine hydrolase domain-containing protein [Methylocapsa sp. S129]